ncbi:MAG: threonine synthase [Zestosphaera sp.]
MAYITGYRCARCGTLHTPKSPHTTCRSCGGPLLAVYDIEAVKDVVDKHVLTRRSPTMWRYSDLMPVFNKNNIVSLGEGYTPLIRLDNAGRELGLRDLLMKDEGRNPTATFKDRPVSVAVSALRELGVKSIAMPTAGNAGAALAAYGARAGLEVHVVMPSDTPKPIYVEALARGVNVITVDGLISDAGRIVAEGASKHGWFDISTMRTPYRAEGTKTMGYEVAEQLGWESPDVIVFPTGGGEGVIGIWKGFKELVELGWVDGTPRIVVVQSEGCRPVVEAFTKGRESAEFFSACETIASGLRVPKPFADVEILKAIRETRGTALAVSDLEIMDSLKELATLEGVLPCPEGAAAYAAVRKLMDSKLVDRDERVVIYNTGSGLKYIDVISKALYGGSASTRKN